MIVKFETDNREVIILDNIERIINYRMDKNNIIRVLNGEFLFVNGEYIQKFDDIFISNNLINEHYNNNEYNIPYCYITLSNGDHKMIAFHEGYVMNNNGKTIDRL